MTERASPTAAILVSRIAYAARRHWLFCVGFPLLTVVMTWPAFAYVVDSSVFWLPNRSPDAWMKFWDAWHLRFIAADPAAYLFTERLFHPGGLSLVYHNFSFPHMLALSALQSLMPASAAFNLCYLLIIGANGIAAYIFLLRLVGARAIAFVGAVVFALSPFVLSQAHHPDVILIAVLPLSLYFLDRGVVEGRPRHIGLAALFMALTLYTGMYIYVCLVITVAVFTIGYISRYASSAAFWRRLILLALVVGAVSLIRVYPLIEDGSRFEDALEKHGGVEKNTDLLASFVNPSHPLVQAALADELGVDALRLNPASYLGYAPLLLIALGLLRGLNRREMAPWLLLLLLFFVLRLGSALEVAGVVYADVHLPKRWLSQLAPFLFEPFWDASLFHIGAALPLAVLACFGLKTALEAIPAKFHIALLAAALCVTCFEYYQRHEPLVVAPESADFLAWLRADDEGDPIRLIHLPMGRHESKRYGYFQSLSGYPQVEGLASRTPAGAYRYIDSNLILNAWRRDHFISCLPAGRAKYLAALDQLLADGFSHVVLHTGAPRSQYMAPSFSAIRPAYADAHTTLFRLADLRDSCHDEAIPARIDHDYLRRLALSSALIADAGTPILSFHAAAPMDADSLRYFSDLFLYWKRLEHAYIEDGALQIQRDHPDPASLERLLADSRLLVLAYDPATTSAASLRSLDDALAPGFRACLPLVDQAEARAAYYARSDFPCELIAAENKLEVRYDNALRLLNRLIDFDAGVLTVDVWWSDIPAAPHSVSIQLFDGDGKRAAGQDFSVGVHPLAKYPLDLSALAPGEYGINLIVYNYETGSSVPGAIAESQSRFDRAFEIGRIRVP